MTAPSTTTDQILDSVSAILAAQGLTAGDLLAHAERSAGTTSASAAPYPTLRQRVEKVERGLTKNTKRTWKTHLDRLLEGTAELCDCLCDACLDLEEGCRCDCAACNGSKLKIEGRPDLVLSRNAVVPSDVEEWATVAERHAQKKAIAQNKVRVARGLKEKPTSGQGGRENAVTAYRRLFRGLVEDGIWDKNPAEHVHKGRRDDAQRRSMHDWEIDQYIEVLVTGGDDPELDLLLGWFALETGARQGGTISLRLSRIKPATQMIELFEKGKKLADQPVSAELIEALLAHAAARGGPACDPTSATYDPQSPVFYFGNPKRSRKKGPDGRLVPSDGPAPLTGRRFDTLYRRIQLSLPWANEVRFTNHGVRRTGASIIERIAGNETARLFLRHGSRTTTQTYTQATLERLVEAVSVMTGSAHPLARSGE